MEEKVQRQLVEVGSKLLEDLPSSKDELLKLLEQAATSLSEMDQSPSTSIMESMQPFLDAIIKMELLKHQDRDVKILVATCICEITRIAAPEAPYSGDVLKDVFHLIVDTFSGLSEASSPSFGRSVVILEILAKCRSCVAMLDLESDDLVNKMFSTFFSVASDDHQESILSSMQTIMVLLIEEIEDVREDLLLIILSVLGRNRSDISPAARKLAMNVIEQCAKKLETGIKQFLISSISGDNRSTDNQIDYHEVIYDVYRCAPNILSGVAPYITGELLADKLETRLKAVELVGDLFAVPGSPISESFQPIFSEFLKRLTDRVVGVRMSVLEHVKNCLLADPFRAEAPQIFSALCDRLLDYDENVRKQVVDVIFNLACYALSSIPVETIKLLADRLRDKSLLVKSYTMEKLAEIFKVYCVKSTEGSKNLSEFDWIPGKIMRCLYDKDFRSDTIESTLSGSLFPAEFSAKNRVKHWIRVFSAFDKVELKAFEKILEHKQRLQQEMQRYLSLRQMHQNGDVPEIQKKVLFCFRIMSRSFAEPVKAEENFQILDQLNDTNIWKILTSLLDPSTSLCQTFSSREDLLKILGEKHRLNEFLSNLSLKCSYLIFNKEHVKDILLEAARHKSSGNAQLTQSCMDILVILARFCPLLLGGAEEELVNFLKDDDDVIKEGALHILAKAGGTIREQLAVSSSSVDLILERFCLEGTRRQAKYAVHALAAITKDDGLKSLSVLYKRLVDMLEEKRHLPAVLQSLGCIAQTAMPVFETREGEIEKFIKNKILECGSKEDNSNVDWDSRSELCLLKIYGIKTLVKSYLPVKDAQIRPGIDDLLEILRKMLCFGELSTDTESSSVDKAHLRLASAKAVLRLSKQWDHKIPIDIFHLTLRTPEIPFPQARKLFLSKVHQYIKDRLLDVKYACAFLFNSVGSKPSDLEEEKQNLVDIIQMHHQAKARQPPVQSDATPVSPYPEHILPYLVHSLAHLSCPCVDEWKDVKAFEPIYRKLYLIVSMLVQKDEDAKLDSGSNTEESISAIVSIFQSIKSSEDIVDAAKSKNSHAISDLGLAVTKRLSQKEDDLQKLASRVSLPTMLYKPPEEEESNESMAKGHTWLADGSVLAYLESLNLETDQKVVSDVAEDQARKDSETEANEMPLGKIIRKLKSQGTKSRTGKKKSSSVKARDADNDVDILKMVREINLDNLGISSKFESSNGHKNFSSEEKSEVDHQKAQKRKVSEISSIPVPKRRRSSYGHSGLRSTQSPLNPSLKALGHDSSPNSGDKKLRLKESAESNFLQKSRSFSSKLKGKTTVLGHNDNEDGDPDEDDLMMRTLTDKKNAANKSVTESTKKRKRRSVAGLAKCSTKKSVIDNEELIGCKIKVWWPLDKEFYEGTVKSYDPLKGKHVILYEDGDVEVLRLDKERWQLVDRKPPKKLSSSQPAFSAVWSPSKKSRSSSGSNPKKKSTKIVKGIRTPKKKSKQVPKELKDKGDPDVSLDPEATAATEEDESQGEPQRVTEDLSDLEESIKEQSVSRGAQLDEADKSPNHSEESDEETKSNFKTEVSEDIENTVQDAKKSDAIEEREADDLSESLEKDAKKDNSDSEGNQQMLAAEDSHAEPEKVSIESSQHLDVEEDEISDDEPLSNWKHKVKKPAPK
ncbi:hypothetical protein K2173_017968 [Erythroxylum novogranatense]|uniref:Uncharacterized protein n=1 Tax=Erythroxylum novogranatense TaxID=1862640 RepID=A0AAV8TUC3_9ROSI|nr:hypothetical protein K2173_017968 [Erythroxylum novogranatense]